MRCDPLALGGEPRSRPNPVALLRSSAVSDQNSDMPTVPPPPNLLWQMSPQDFNDWRAKNDIPKLFAFFLELLPKFDEWLATLPVDMDILCQLVPTADLFKGEAQKVIVRRDDDLPKVVRIECFEGTPEAATQWWRTRHRAIEVLGVFLPYRAWARRTLRRNRFFEYDQLNHQRSDDLIYTSWRGVTPSSAHLFGLFEVLKLGQTEVTNQVRLGDRNLDFCDLDGLTVTGPLYGARWARISYSSCRELRLRDTELAFYAFYKCAMEKVVIENARLQDFSFTEIHGMTVEARDSFIYRMMFDRTDVQPFLRNTDTRDVEFIPPTEAWPEGVARTFRLLRATFQSNGLRKEAADAYYNERNYERKALSRPYQNNRATLSIIRNGGDPSSSIALYRDGYLSFRQAAWEIMRTYMARPRLIGHPNALCGVFKANLRWLASSIEWAVWGYGERPARIFMASLFAIVGYASYYYLCGEFIRTPANVHLNWWDSLYYSMVTFTTLGYGDIAPNGASLKIIAGSEAFIGAFAVGLTVAGFSNRSRY